VHFSPFLRAPSPIGEFGTYTVRFSPIDGGLARIGEKRTASLNAQLKF
jgi:hypothetical protein